MKLGRGRSAACGWRFEFAKVATAVMVASLLGAGMFAAPASAAAPPILWQVPESTFENGSAAGRIGNPRGVAVDRSSGNVFVADRFNARIDEFSPWGEFLRAFGWNVNASSPEEKLQVCTAVTGCKGGTKGSGTGQLGDIAGIAVGSNGDVYIVDRSNNRVQVFAPDGSFVVMFGGKVNKTKVEASAPAAEQNRCPVSAGDVCQAGTPGTGDGEFSSTIGNNTKLTDYIEAGPGGTVYVGDTDRLQVFNAEGVFQSQIPLPKEGEVAGAPNEGKGEAGPLAIDEAGNLYFDFEPEFQSGTPRFPIIYKHTVTGWSLFAQTGMSIESLAVDNAGNVYAGADPFQGFIAQGLEPRLIEFDAVGNKLLPTKEEEEAAEQEPPVAPFPFGQVLLRPDTLTEIDSLAASSACGIPGQDLFATYVATDRSLLRAYGPHPDPTVCPPPEQPPSITDQLTASVDEDGATVKAKINSHFWPTTRYLVQYGIGKCSEGGCTQEQPARPGVLLNSESNLSVSTAGISLSGLVPETTYHYRFIATTKFVGASGAEVEAKGLGGKVGVDGAEGTFTTLSSTLPSKTSCPNQSFRFGLSARLSDCRAYEMVSPVDKAGGDIISLLNPLSLFTSLSQSATSGNGFTYSSYRSFGATKAAPYVSQYLATRDPSAGWVTNGLSPARGRPLWNSPVEVFENEYKAFSPDLCQAWMRLEFEAEPTLDPVAVAAYPNVYRRENCGAAPKYHALTTVEPPGLSPEQYFPEFQGSSADGRCSVFRAQGSLTSEAPNLGEFKTILYETCEGNLQLVAVLPNGSPGSTPSAAGAPNLGEANVEFQNFSGLVKGAVSTDGSRIYWTASGNGPGKLYLRINADQPPTVSGVCDENEPQGACTLAVSPGSAARFWSGNENGSRAIFSEGTKLFEYVLNEEGVLPSGEVKPIAEGFQGLLGASQDAQRIYFVSAKQIGGKGTAGQSNLYYREVGGEPIFIGTLAPSDGSTEIFSSLRWLAVIPVPFRHSARVSPDGLHATFTSSAPLTGYNNTDQNSGEADLEVFIYDATTSKLICASCDPNGSRPVGRDIGSPLTSIATPQWAAATIPTWETQFYASRVLSDDGSRLFFNSYGPLVGRDTNGKEDVYEWQSAASRPACEEAGAERYVESAGGCISLITSGESASDSEFLDASPNAGDVFFATAASLLPQDPGQIDVYDARSGGGFPQQVSRTECQGSACQNAGPPPTSSTPSSETFAGPGNVKKPKPCPKGKHQVKVKKGGKVRCVKNKAKSKHGGKQGHKGKKGKAGGNGK